MWALARSRWAGDPQVLVQRIAVRIACLTEWDEQSLSTAVWALAVLGYRDAALPLLANARLDVQNLRSFPTASLCVLTWTCGMLGMREDPTPALLVVWPSRTSELSISQLVMVARSFAGIWPRIRLHRKETGFNAKQNQCPDGESFVSLTGVPSMTGLLFLGPPRSFAEVAPHIPHIPTHSQKHPRNGASQVLPKKLLRGSAGTFFQGPE